MPFSTVAALSSSRRGQSFFAIFPIFPIFLAFPAMSFVLISGKDPQTVWADHCCRNSRNARPAKKKCTLTEVQGKFLAGGQNEKAKIDLGFGIACSVIVLDITGLGGDGLLVGRAAFRRCRFH
jgi:hypothetical protein